MPFGYKVLEKPSTRTPFKRLGLPKNKKDILPEPKNIYQQPRAICVGKPSEKYEPVILNFSRKRL